MSDAAGYPVHGRCLCGACSFTGRATAMTTSVCHCETCRRWTGGVLFSVDLGGNLDIDAAAPVSVYASSSHMDRVRCKICGAPLYRHDKGLNRYFAVMEALDSADIEIPFPCRTIYQVAAE